MYGFILPYKLAVYEARYKGSRTEPPVSTASRSLHLCSSFWMAAEFIRFSEVADCMNRSKYNVSPNLTCALFFRACIVSRSNCTLYRQESESSLGRSKVEL